MSSDVWNAPLGKGGGSLPRPRKHQRPLQIPLNRSLSQGAREGKKGGGGVEWRITTATPPEMNSPLSTPGGAGLGGRRGRSRDGAHELSPGGGTGGRRRVATSPGMGGGGGRQGGKGSPKGGKGGKGGRRRRSLITTEFSPAEWNINNLNKYKKWVHTIVGRPFWRLLSWKQRLFWEILAQIATWKNWNWIFRADAARQKSEALRSLATQLIEEHDDYTKKNEKVSSASLSIIVIFITNLTITVIINLTTMIPTRLQSTGWRREIGMCISGKMSSRRKLKPWRWQNSTPLLVYPFIPFNALTLGHFHLDTFTFLDTFTWTLSLSWALSLGHFHMDNTFTFLVTHQLWNHYFPKRWNWNFCPRAGEMLTMPWLR